MSQRLLAALLVVGAAAAAVALNVLLLGSASANNEPVGRLSPRANLPQPHSGRSARQTSTAAPTTTTAPTTEPTAPGRSRGGSSVFGVRRSFVAREVGPAAIVFLVVPLGPRVARRPTSGESGASYIGQFLGAESVLLLSIALVLISTLPWVEEWFDGIDRAAIWHRRVAIAGLVLLAPHILLSSSPHGTTLGGPLGAIGAIGLVALVAVGDPAALAVGRARAVARPHTRGARRTRCPRGSSHLRRLRALAARCIARPASSSPRASSTACSTGHRSTTARAAVELRRGRRGRLCVLRLPRAARPFLPVAARLPGRGGPRDRRQAWSKWRCDRSVAASTSSPASSRWSTWKRRTAGTDTRSRSPARRTRTSSASPSRRSATTRRAAGARRARHAGRHRRPARALQPLEGHRPADLDRRRRRRGAVPQLAARARRPICRSGSTSSTAPTAKPPFAEEIRAIADPHPSLHAHLIDTSVDGRLTPERVLAAAAATRANCPSSCAARQGCCAPSRPSCDSPACRQRQIHREYFDWR